MIKEREITNEEMITALGLFFNRDSINNVKILDTKIVDGKLIAIIDVK